MPKVGLWSLFKEKARGKDRWAIRRWVTPATGKPRYERHPAKKYRKIAHDFEALAGYVERLNAELKAAKRAQDAVAWKHAFISPALLEEYQEFLLAKIPSPGLAKTEFSYLKEYVLNFFIGKLNLAYVTDWAKVADSKWASYLRSDAVPASAKTKRDIVIAANRFAKWLHKKRPEDTPLVEFEPLSRAVYKKIEADRTLNEEVRETRLIADSDWNSISKALPENIRGHVMLAYYYGLRRNEAMGVLRGDVKNSHLSVERQLRLIGEHVPTKGRMMRKVPHWFCKPAETYRWVESVQATPMHPRTLSELWTQLMRTLELDYTLHDLRHTFITKALRKHAPRDVQLAAGHKNILTTMGYAHDDRDLGDQAFIPEAS